MAWNLGFGRMNVNSLDKTCDCDQQHAQQRKRRNAGVGAEIGLEKQIHYSRYK